MASRQLISQSRQVSGFDRVVLRCSAGESTLIITQGEREALTIQARPEIASRIKAEVWNGQLTITAGGGWSDRLGDMFQTSLTRPQITYWLTVNRLVDLQITGFARVRFDSLDTERLALRFSGAGGVQIGSLTAGLLEVDLRWAGQVEVAGRVTEQRVQVSMGTYTAPKLQSRKTAVTLRGGGYATVWAVDALDLVVRGPGGVAYYGSPTVSRSLSPVARVTRLGALPA